jgi:hypothetical protein
MEPKSPEDLKNLNTDTYDPVELIYDDNSTMIDRLKARCKRALDAGLISKEAYDEIILGLD